MSDKTHDVIIIGGGPAGLTAGIYTSRHNLETIILEGKKLGGRALEAHWIENYPGFPEGITGPNLMKRFIDQAEKFGVEALLETVIGVNIMDDLIMVSTRKGYHQSKSLIVCTGVTRKTLRVPGEMEFKGRGVSYCGVCDGPFYKDKVVAIVGSGHEAIHDVNMLAETASKVYAIPGKKGYIVEQHKIDQIKENTNVEIIPNTDVATIGGEDFVKYITLKEGPVKKFEVDGVFIILEHISTSSILSKAGIETDEGGCILVDNDQKTNLKGVFAAGDCSCKGMQIVTATGMGAKAALSVMKYIKSMS